MATTKIWDISSGLNRVIDYVVNEKKTDSESYSNLHRVIEYARASYKTEKQLYVTSINCCEDTILEEIKKAEKIVILTHELPDGDAVGSSLATGLALEEMGKNVDIIIPEYSKSFSFLPKIDKLKKACEILKGRKINQGDVGYIIDIFDFLPVMFIFYDQDSEFPAEIKLLWDENILNFMHYETTFYVANQLFDILEELILGENN